MPGTYLYGWDSVNEVWVKLVCDATGKLKIDPALILENPPTEALATKAATSEWSYDHWKNVAAHHAKYTNAEAQLIADARILIHKGIATAHQDAPNLILTHKSIAAAHHAKYTDLEAQTACNLNGNLYWSCSGIYFNAEYPGLETSQRYEGGYVTVLVNDTPFRANVILPDGATITSIIGYGNAASEGRNCYLRRITLSGAALVTMSGAAFNTEDITISYATVDNSLYGYFLLTNLMQADDKIYGVRIKYTL